ncbi:MAG: hypothetical protein E4H15_04495 [Syntrophobacterales bacterium]|nr:MAG: hypothetical protein E4H15_04495 [Syntrophobacterales bacterium]
MQKTGFEKTVEEIFQERADVLYRTGEALSDALGKLTDIGKIVDSGIKSLHTLTGNEEPAAIGKLYASINEEISRYDRAREYAKLRYRYLIITREAMGFRRHTWVEEIYGIPPKRKHLSRTREHI